MGVEIAAYKSATGVATLVAATAPLPTGSSALYNNITTATTTVVKSGPGILYAIMINLTAAGTITIFDNTSASGNKIGTIKASMPEGMYNYTGLNFTTGLTIVTGAASDVTIIYA